MSQEFVPQSIPPPVHMHTADRRNSIIDESRDRTNVPLQWSTGSYSFEEEKE